MATTHSSRDLKDRVTFQAREADANGDLLGDWAEGFSRLAGVTYLRGGETGLQGRLQGRAPVLVIVREDRETRTLGTHWRATLGSPRPAVLNIRSIAPSNRRGFLEITCEVGADD